MESLATVVNGVKSLTVVEKHCILDVWGGPGYSSATFGVYTNINQRSCERLKAFTSDSNELSHYANVGTSQNQFQRRIQNSLKHLKRNFLRG